MKPLVIGGAVLALLVLIPRQAFAYLDPGTGSMVFQTIIAALAGVAFGIRVYWGRIRSWFGGRAPSGRTDGSRREETP